MIKIKIDSVENLYNTISGIFSKFNNFIAVYNRRLLRFIALPYCYFRLVNWEECTASRYQVFCDFLFIFFKLKYFPDNYSPCRLWEKKRDQWQHYYGSIYDPHQRARLRKEVQRKEYLILFDDKYICYQLCKSANLPLPKQYGVTVSQINFKSIIKSVLITNPMQKIIIKPTRGRGGKGIMLAYLNNDDIFIQKNDIKTVLDNFILGYEVVIQEFIQQHQLLSNIASSINTVRVVTLLSKNDKVLILGAYIRFGVGNAFVDNVSSGGISVGIDLAKGCLNKIAFDGKGKLYNFHPTSKFAFEGFHVPFWKEVVALSKKTQNEFPYYKLLGQDIAISSEGPVIIEINGSHDNVALEQRCGPILADNKIRNEFIKYKLLINNF